ncbi:MAG: hypothetical protein WD969_08745 [Paracoccaceae bacterium]
MTITASQGQNGAGGDVAAARSDLSKVTDGVSNVNSIFSLGLGGFLSFDVDPLRLGSPIVVIEVTSGTPNPSFPEAANLFLGGSVVGTGLSDSNSFSGGTLIGNLSNDGDLTPFGVNGAVITKTQNNLTTTFTINFANVGSGVFSRVTLVDTTTGTGTGVDGFDVGEFSVNAVPLPAPALLLLSGLAGIGFVSRRRRAA